jgi:hypothetical protein
VQTCIVHLIRNTFHLASKRDWDALKRDLKPVYTAVNAAAARAALDDLTEKWGRQYGAVASLRGRERAGERVLGLRDGKGGARSGRRDPGRAQPEPVVDRV